MDSETVCTKDLKKDLGPIRRDAPAPGWAGLPPCFTSQLARSFCTMLLFMRFTGGEQPWVRVRRTHPLSWSLGGQRELCMRVGREHPLLRLAPLLFTGGGGSRRGRVAEILP